MQRFLSDIEQQLKALDESGTGKGAESVVVDVRKPRPGRGPRFLLQGEGEREFIRMNSNSYLGMGLREEVRHAEEKAAAKYGVGPGAVRFISGTYDVHVELEKALAKFHEREACMIASAAYVSVMGVLFCLSSPETVIISDELNHNCIVNGMKLAPSKAKRVYKHLDYAALEQHLVEVGSDRAIVITDGVFSMRGDHAALDRIAALTRKHGALLLVDDSHGVGSFGATGRGTEEITGGRADVLIGTLGKAFGVNGGYICCSATVARWLREKNPFYIYSNPIAPGEAAASLASLQLLQSTQGGELLKHLRAMTSRFRDGLRKLGFETIDGQHPVVPLLVRDTDRTRALVLHLRKHGVLATGLNYPVVPKGEQLIRFQVSADHAEGDIDEVLRVLSTFK